ncbi:MAG: hypothetical protein GYA23_04765 [Methanomicrobiales archaeon]|nr:hypothetical protein [Methanomicrobiales archaeon]
MTPRTMANRPVFFAIIVACALLLLACTAGCTQAAAPGQGQTAEQKQYVEVTVTQPDATHIVVTYQGGPNMQTLMELETMITDSTGKNKIQSVGSRLATTPITIRGTNTIEGDFAGTDHVVVTGYLSDGSRKVMLDTTI